jgi:hypothetical protein
MGPYLLGVLSPETAATNDHQIRSPICAAIYHRQISAVLDHRQHQSPPQAVNAKLTANKALADAVCVGVKPKRFRM